MEEIDGSSLLEKNPIRALMFKDAFMEEIVEGLKAEQVAKEDMDEVLFLTATNAVLERVGTTFPEDMLCIFQDNLDDYLAIALINHEYDTDLLALFRDQFLEAKGDSFDDERQLMEALTAFEDEWWGTSKDFLNGKVPNDLMDESKEKMATVLHGDGECDCEECEEEEYWAARAYIIRDLWFPDMAESMKKESMPSPQKRERLFLTVTNAILDTVVNVMPDFMNSDLFEGLDQSLQLSLVNKDNKVDVLEMFETALIKFEDQWWGTSLKELGGKSPEEAMKAMAKKYGL